MPLLIGPDIDRLDTETPWLSAPDPDRVEQARAQVDRLLQRIPNHLAYVLRAHLLEGQPQTEIGETIGLGQPAVHARILVAIERVRWVSTNLVDLTAPEVEHLLLTAGHPEGVCAAGAHYWVEHSSVGHESIPQPTLWTRLRDRLWPLRGTGDVGDIYDGLRLIRDLRAHPGRTDRLTGDPPGRALSRGAALGPSNEPDAV